jgi:ABC-type taurine transport system ATPase subunit
MQLDNELCQAQHKTNQINQQMITQVSAVYSCVFEQDALMPYVKQ